MAAVCPKADWWMPLVHWWGGGRTPWWDGNGDAVFTISDVGWIANWLFHAPGDSFMALIFSWFPIVAMFFELDCSFMGGWLTAIISAILWGCLLVLSVVIWEMFTGKSYT